MKIPGYESIYVLKWPLKNDVSVAPAREITLHSLYKAFAINLAIVVFPVPGGPVNKIDNPLE